MNTAIYPAEDNSPRRIVCLTEETTEALYLLGEEDRIVGISGYTVRPPRARKEKPKVSAFTSAKIDKITALEPDLVLGFSDLQADIAAELIRKGIPVHVFNQRSVAEILEMLRVLGALVNASEKAATLIEQLRANIIAAKTAAAALPRRPKVYFEEWNDPLISGIRWVAELVEIAGGVDCFPELSREPMGKNRIITDPMTVVDRAPDIIIGSWCGKRFRPEHVAGRPGWEQVPAVVNQQIFEVKSAEILQPGPAALSDGLGRISRIILDWVDSHARSPS